MSREGTDMRDWYPAGGFILTLVIVLILLRVFGLI